MAFKSVGRMLACFVWLTTLGSVPALAEETDEILSDADFYGGQAYAAELPAAENKTSADLSKLIRPEQLEPAAKSFLEEIAARTWKYLVVSTGKPGMPIDYSDKRSFKKILANTVESGAPTDHLILRKNKKHTPADYTTTTNLGLFLMALPGAVDLGLLKSSEAEKRLSAILGFLEKIPKSKGGLFYNYFKTKDGKTDEKLYVSSVDNAWMAAGLFVAANSPLRADLRERAAALYRAMDFSAFYDPALGQLWLGYSDKDHKTDPYHYGMLCTETRVLSMIAIAKNQAPKEHWFRVFRTLPKEWDWQSQIPQGSQKTLAGFTYFSGYYMVDGLPIVPSWGGSLFEFLMPLLVVPELDVAPKGFGLNDIHAVYLHKEFCKNSGMYPVWGMSPSSMPSAPGDFKYGEFGYNKLGAKGYPADKGIVTPHASILALEVDTAGVVENLQILKNKYPGIWTELGFYDAVDVKTGKVAPNYLTLDQAMIFLAVHNYLTGGATRKRFFTGEIEAAMKPLLSEEKFY